MERTLRKAEEEYRVFFKKPATVPEFWSALSFEIQVGKFDVAALHLDQLLKKEPKEQTDAELLVIEEVEGLSTFLKLKNIRRWFDQPELQSQAERNVDTLIQRVTTALETKLGDGERLSKLIRSLSAATIEERAFAFAQIKRSANGRCPTWWKPANHGRQAGAAAHCRHHAGTRQRDRAALAGGSAAEGQGAERNRSSLPPARHRPAAAATRGPCTTFGTCPARRKRRRSFAQGQGNAVALPAPGSRKVAGGEGCPDRVGGAILSASDALADPKRIRVWEWNGTKIEDKPVVFTAQQAEELFGLRHAARPSTSTRPTVPPRSFT